VNGVIIKEHTHMKKIKNAYKDLGVAGLTPIILATWETEIGSVKS
jgi:hypothetical protein